MFGRRIRYLTVLLLSLVFYAAVGTRLGCIVALTALGLPWLSLLVSLPAMLTLRPEVKTVEYVQQGQAADASILAGCNLPAPPFRGKLQLENCITGEKALYTPGTGLPTEHCGGMVITVEKGRVCDYMGLFSFPVRARGSRTVLVRPNPVPISPALDLKVLTQEPQSVRWEVTAKTGSARQSDAGEGRKVPILLTMDLIGSPEELDRKLGRFLWLGSSIVRQGAAFEARVMTGEGLRVFGVRNPQELKRTVDELLCASAPKLGSVRDYRFQAAWQYCIGGEADEA